MEMASRAMRAKISDPTADEDEAIVIAVLGRGVFGFHGGH